MHGGKITLGCIAAHNRIGPAVAKQVDSAIQQSIQSAQADPLTALPYIKTHSQEMTAEVLDAHISTFVNAFSEDLGETGHAAVLALEEAAYKTGILP